MFRREQVAKLVVDPTYNAVRIEVLPSGSEARMVREYRESGMPLQTAPNERHSDKLSAGSQNSGKP